MSKIEVKANFTVDEAGQIEGLAWPFGSPDRVGDMIEKGAFATAMIFSVARILEYSNSDLRPHGEDSPAQ